MSRKPKTGKTAKATKAVVARRIEEVLRIRLDGAEFWDVREYAREKEAEEGSAWQLGRGDKPLSDGQLRRYVARVDRMVAESCRASRKKLFRRHLAQRRNLFAKAVSQGDVRAALAVLQDEAKLIGLYAPVKVAPTNPQGDQAYESLSDAEVAALRRSMPVWARELEIRLLTGQMLTTDRFRVDPALILQKAGMTPDLWQANLLRSATWNRALLLCSRQVGKSQTAGALALGEALMFPRSLILLLSPTLRQSGELFRDKLLPLWRAAGRPMLDRPPTQLSLELSNGSRIISLPESEGGIRGYSGVRLLAIDEAARVSDGLYRAVRPMLAVSNGRLIAMSTPFGRRGWFYEEWTATRSWKRVEIKAKDCPRIRKGFLAEERASLGERWYRQEYCCSFEDVVGAVFSRAAAIAFNRAGS